MVALSFLEALLATDPVARQVCSMGGDRLFVFEFHYSKGLKLKLLR